MGLLIFWRNVYVAKLTPAGSITPTNTISKQTGKVVSGSITPTNTLSFLINKTWSGVVTPTGTIVKTFLRTVVGSITPVGSLVRLVGKTLAGSITPTSALNVGFSLAGLKAAFSMFKPKRRETSPGSGFFRVTRATVKERIAKPNIHRVAVFKGVNKTSEPT